MAKKSRRNWYPVYGSDNKCVGENTCIAVITMWLLGFTLWASSYGGVFRSEFTPHFIGRMPRHCAAVIWLRDTYGNAHMFPGPRTSCLGTKWPVTQKTQDKLLRYKMTCDTKDPGQVTQVQNDLWHKRPRTSYSGTKWPGTQKTQDKLLRYKMTRDTKDPGQVTQVQNDLGHNDLRQVARVQNDLGHNDLRQVAWVQNDLGHNDLRQVARVQNDLGHNDLRQVAWVQKDWNNRPQDKMLQKKIHWNKYCSTVTRSHDLTLVPCNSRVNAFRYSFFINAPFLWNSLPTEIVHCPSYNSFKFNLCKSLL